MWRKDMGRRGSTFQQVCRDAQARHTGSMSEEGTKGNRCLEVDMLAAWPLDADLAEVLACGRHEKSSIATCVVGHKRGFQAHMTISWIRLTMVVGGDP